MARDRSGSLTGFACQAPSLGPYVPSSVLTDLRAEHQRYAAAHRPPAHRLPPSAPGPRKGGRWLRTADAPGLRPAANGVASPPWTSGPRLRWPWPIGDCRRPSLRRRPGPPLASLRPLRGRLGRLRHSVLGLALGLLRVDLAVRPPRHGGLPPGPSAPEPRRVPPGRPRPRPALARPSLSWSPGRANGLRSSRLGPLAVPGGDRSLRPPAPGVGADIGGIQGVSQRMQTGSDWRRPAAAGTVLHQV